MKPDNDDRGPMSTGDPVQPLGAAGADTIQAFLSFYPWDLALPEVETAARLVALSGAVLRLVSPVALGGGGSVCAQLRITLPAGLHDRRGSTDRLFDLNGVVVSTRTLEGDQDRFQIDVALDRYCLGAVQAIRERLSERSGQSAGASSYPGGPT